jgi:Domain of unknown function (DUF6265)
MVMAGAIFAALLTNAASAAAQEASLSDFAWLTGTWRGSGPEGAVAEIRYMEPEAGVLPALFGLHRPSEVLIMEVISMVQEDDGLFLYVRHLDPALVPQEDGPAIRLHLTERHGDTFVFQNVRPGENPVRSVLVRTADGFTSWSELARPDGRTDTIRVAYRKVTPD